MKDLPLGRTQAEPQVCFILVSLGKQKIEGCMITGSSKEPLWRTRIPGLYKSLSARRDKHSALLTKGLQGHVCLAGIEIRRAFNSVQSRNCFLTSEVILLDDNARLQRQNQQSTWCSQDECTGSELSIFLKLCEIKVSLCIKKMIKLYDPLFRNTRENHVNTQEDFFSLSYTPRFVLHYTRFDVTERL